LLCPLCQREQVVEIGVTMGPARLVMRSCSGCDARWWDDNEGNRLGISQVLTFAGQTRRRRRRVTVADVLAAPPAGEPALAPPAPADARVDAAPRP